MIRRLTKQKQVVEKNDPIFGNKYNFNKNLCICPYMHAHTLF
jgi:hypothetical protein